MEKRKMSVLAIIIIFIVALIIGGGLGYFIYKATDRDAIYTTVGDKNTQKFNEVEVKNELAVNKNNNNVITDLEDVIKYDGSKSITLNGKKYNISYVSEKFEHFNDSEIKQTEVKLFLDNKYVGTVNLNYILDVEKTYGNYGYDVELYTLSQDYILVMLKTKYNNGISNPYSKRVFFILNKDGIHIDTLKWDNATVITDKEMNKLEYQIDNEGITLYEVYGNGARKIKYVPIRNFIKEELLKLYNENEVLLAGK